MEKPFESLAGVSSVVSGFSGGPEVDPTYDEVASKKTGHTEAVEVIYDPSVVPYDSLLQVYWHNVDPLDDGGQFCDRGAPYRPVIFVSTPAERAAAESTKAALAAPVRPSRSRCPSRTPPRSTPPRSITRTSTGPTPPATTPIVSGAAATRAWSSCGATPPVTSAPPL